MPGTDANNQIEIIFNLLGSPIEQDIESIPNPRAKEKVLRMSKRPAKAFETVFKDSNPQALDLLKKMLEFNPDKRMSVEDALNHPYLAALHFPDDEPVTTPVSLFDFEYERQLLTMRDLKDLMYEEILLYHFHRKRQEYERNKASFLASNIVSIPSQGLVKPEIEDESDEEMN